MRFWRFAPPDPTFTQLGGAYHPLLVALSVAIAIAGALAMLRAVQRLTVAETPGLRRLWAVGGALSMAFGIWAMHFMGMIALVLPIPMEYDFPLTVLSLVPAVLGSLAAVHVLGARKPDSWSIHRGAALIGGGIGAMHYAGMEAMRFDGTLHYDPTLFMLSVCAAYALALAALYLRPRFTDKVDQRLSWVRELLSAVVLGTAVAAMHYIAMAAATFHTTTSTGEAHLHAPPFVLGGVISAMALILGIVWLGSLLDRRLASVGASLRKSEARNRAIIAAMQDAHFLTDARGQILSLNPAATTIFGYAAEELMGNNVKVLLPEPHAGRHDSYIERYVTTREPHILGTKRRDLSGRRKDGTLFPIELLITSFEMDGQQFFSGTIRDLSEFNASIENTKRLTAAIDQAAEAIVILDSAMHVTYANPAFWILAGGSPKEALGRTLDDLEWTVADPGARAEMYTAIRAGRMWSGRLSSTRPDGSLRIQAATATPVIRDGRIGCYIQIWRDITEQVQMEQQLRHAQKLESIGQLSAGIAHEINTPSQFVRDNILFLRDAYADLLGAITASTSAADTPEPTTLAARLEGADFDFLRDEIPRALEQSIEGMNRITKIVRAMKEFSHQGQDKVPSDLNHAIESTITVATNEWKYVADVAFDLDSGLPPVPCLLHEFNQVILNIVVNAAHAIADVVGGENEKGKITVSTRKLDPWAEIRISDTGTGMTEDVKARIFDPFFTTKEVGKGTGQGLSIAYAAIVEKHCGSIDVETDVGKGTCFVIRLPLSDSKTRERSAAA
jgi:PAS domain S-box-containing protein